MSAVPKTTYAKKRQHLIAPKPTSEISPENVIPDIVIEDKPGDEDEKKDEVKKPLRETNRKRISQRQKQIDFGKNTLGYATYRKSVKR